MSYITLLLLAISVSADAFAVSISAGITEKKISQKQAISLAFTFGLFQAIMPIIGFYLTSLFEKSILHYDHWLAFFLLGYIWWNMIYQWWKWWEENIIEKNIFHFYSLIVLGIATSIDALAIGISLTATTPSIFFPAIVIWIFTFALSYIWVEFWKKLGKKVWSHSEIIGWLILLGIGTNILIQHLYS